MVKLRTFYGLKIKASSITETIVATTIIIIVFAIVTFSLSNVLRNRVENDTSFIEHKINELIYKNRFEKIKLPATFNTGEWIINVFEENESAVHFIVFEAIKNKSKKKIRRKIIANEN